MIGDSVCTNQTTVVNTHNFRGQRWSGKREVSHFQQIKFHEWKFSLWKPQTTVVNANNFRGQRSSGKFWCSISNRNMVMSGNSVCANQRPQWLMPITFEDRGQVEIVRCPITSRKIVMRRNSVCANHRPLWLRSITFKVKGQVENFGNWFSS